MKIKESLNVTFDETPPPSKTSPLVDDELDEEVKKVTEKKRLERDIEDETLEIDEIVNIKESRNHPLENNVNEALKDESWIIAMQEELNQFVANDVWELVPQPKNMTIIGTKWVYRNKLDENDVVSRNKARLVAQGYNQQEGIDYDETYAPVARLESIRILLAYACALDFKLFQMDVKSAFLNGFINEEVYVAQPSGFIDFEKPDHVYKLKKALYGLKQAPKAWYDRLKAFLIKHEYNMGMVDNTFFTKKKSSNLIIVQIYVQWHHILSLRFELVIGLDHAGIAHIIKAGTSGQDEMDIFMTHGSMAFVDGTSQRAWWGLFGRRGLCDYFTICNHGKVASTGGGNGLCIGTFITLEDPDNIIALHGASAGVSRVFGVEWAVEDWGGKGRFWRWLVGGGDRGLDVRGSLVGLFWMLLSVVLGQFGGVETESMDWYFVGGGLHSGVRCANLVERVLVKRTISGWDSMKGG
ncbi:retrovirus-related pol polyprotein from transposon TNT 1-94 [Tanacetum coccineum]